MSLKTNAELIKTKINEGKAKLKLPESASLQEFIDKIGTATPTKPQLYHVATIEERDAITDMETDDLCLVYANINRAPEKGEIVTNLTVPYKFNFSSQITETIRFRWAKADGTVPGPMDGFITNTRLSWGIYYINNDGTYDVNINIEYSSTDGINYTRTAITGYIMLDGSFEEINFTDELDHTFIFDEGIKYDETTTTNYNPLVLEPWIINSVSFEGLFQYDKDTWVTANIAINTPSNAVMQGYKIYNNEGFVNGTLGLNADLVSLKNINDLLNNKIECGKSLVYFFITLTGGSTDTSMLPILPFLDTSKVEDMSQAFTNCFATELDLSHFNTSNVTSMNNMFRNCNKVVNLNLSNFDTRNVGSVGYQSMFEGCTALESLDISSFVFKEGINIGLNYTFYNCTSLKYLNISNMIFDNVTAYKSMFVGVPADCEIIVKTEKEKQWVLDRRSDFTNIVVAGS